MRRGHAHVAITAGLLLGGLLGAGCSVVPAPERPDWNVFALEAPAPAADAPAAEGPVAILALPESAAGYGTARMAYSRGDGRIEYYAEHRWADTPARMLVPLFQDALARTGAFSAVAAMPTRAAADFLIESQVMLFRLEPEGDAPRFRARLGLTVVAPGSPAGTRTRVLDVNEPIPSGAGPAEGVTAARRAAARLAEAAAAFCAEIARESARDPAP